MRHFLLSSLSPGLKGLLSSLFYFILLLAPACSWWNLKFPDRGLNPCPWQWFLRILTNGVPGNSHHPHFRDEKTETWRGEERAHTELEVVGFGSSAHWFWSPCSFHGVTGEARQALGVWRWEQGCGIQFFRLHLTQGVGLGVKCIRNSVRVPLAGAVPRAFNRLEKVQPFFDHDCTQNGAFSSWVCPEGDTLL